MSNKYYSDMEVIPRERKRQYVEEKLQWLIPYAYRSAPAIKDKMDKAGVKPADIKTVADLVAIPTTKKEDLSALQKARPPFGGFFASQLENLQRIYVSPGPTYEPHASRARSEWEARSGVKSYFSAGFGRGDIVINSFSYHLSPGGLHIDEALETLGATIVPTGTGNTELQVQIMHDLKATGFIGSPSFLMTVIKKAEELGYSFQRDFAVKKAYFIGEYLPPQLRHAFEVDYGINTIQGYGISEVVDIAYECGQKSGMHIDDELLTVEIVDPITGKQVGPGVPGEIVVTSFNESFPLVRLATGDISSYTDEPCPCGRTAYKLTGILGRIGISVKVRNLFLHPKQVEEVISKFDSIANFQVIVGRRGERDELSLNLELKDENLDKARLSADLARSFQDICRMKLDNVNFLAKGAIAEKRKPILDERVWK